MAHMDPKEWPGKWSPEALREIHDMEIDWADAQGELASEMQKAAGDIAYLLQQIAIKGPIVKRDVTRAQDGLRHLARTIQEIQKMLPATKELLAHYPPRNFPE